MSILNTHTLTPEEEKHKNDKEKGIQPKYFPSANQFGFCLDPPPS